MKRKLLAILFAFAISLLGAGYASAQSADASGNCQTGDKLNDLFCSTNLNDMLNQSFQIAISVGAVLAMLRIAYAGYLYMGSDMWSNKTKAKEVFQDAIIGLLVLLAIWLILYQINPDILSLRLTGISNN